MMRNAVILGMVAALAGCATVVQPNAAVDKLDTAHPKYASDECRQARQLALTYDDNVGGRVGLGVGLGLFLGPVGLPFAIAADASQAEKRKAVLAALKRHCEGEIQIAATGPEASSLATQLQQLREQRTRGEIDEAAFETRRRALADQWLDRAAAAQPSPPAPGTRIVLRDFEPLSGVPQGDTETTITQVAREEAQLDAGASLVRRLDARWLRGRPPGAAVEGYALDGLKPGALLSAQYRPGDAGLAATPVELRVQGLESLRGARGSLWVARVAVAGFAPSQQAPYGTPASQRGASITGEVLIELASGLLVGGELQSRYGAYAFKRELVHVHAPTPAAPG